MSRSISYRRHAAELGWFALAAVIAAACLAPWIVTRCAASHENTEPRALNSADAAKIAHRYGELPLAFERNDGQFPRESKFISRGPGYDLFLTSQGAVLNLRKYEPANNAKGETAPAASSLRLDLKMIRAGGSVAVRGEDELPGKVNYFLGDDPDFWRTGIPTFRKVRYTEVFPGVDLVYYGNRSQLEYDFLLAPHANVSAIRFAIDGADQISVDAEGDLHLATNLGDVKLCKPEIYQLNEFGGRARVEGAYVLKGNQVGFKLKAFDRDKALVIDPVLSYSTLLGAASSEQGNSIAVDSQGNAYVTGLTNGIGFPTTAGAFQLTAPAGGAFVSKLNATGTSLIYSTYLSGASGSGSTTGTGIAVDATGNAYVTGYTSAEDFPTLNPIRGGRNNLLISNDSGGSWGPSNIGTNNRPVQTVAIDKNSPATIYAGTGANGGIFKSTNGGLTWSPLNVGFTASCPAIVIDPTSTNIVYAALIAQNTGTGVYKSIDAGNTWTSVSSGISGNSVTALAIDPQNHLTLYAGSTFGLFKTTNGGTSWAGASTGLNFGGFTAIVIDPATPATIYATAGGGGVFKTTNAAGNWSQVNNGLTNTTVRALVMDPNASLTLYAGTAGGGIFKTIDGGASWSAVNTGAMASTVSVGALAMVPTATSTIFAGTSDGRIFKTTNAGGNWNIVYSTTSNTSIRALAIDSSAPGKVVAAVDSLDQSMGFNDAFVTKLNPSGSALVYSTFVGGVSDDQSNAITIDGSGNAYIAGSTTSVDYPTVNAAQGTIGGNQGCGDAFITKLNAAGSAISFSTFLGGSNCDLARAIALDGSGNVYVTGSTSSTNLATPGAFQTTMGAQSDAFVARYTNNGALGYFTYLGGEGTDAGYGVAADNSGNAYITGLTTSTSFPIANAIQSTNGGSVGDAFVTKLNSTGSALVYSTFLGGSDTDSGRGIAVDSAGNAYVTGFTNSSEFPLTPGSLKTKSPFFKTTDGGSNWSNDNYGLKSNVVTAMAMNPLTPSTILAGTRSAVYKSTDGGRTWSPSMNGLVTPSVTSFAVNPANPAIMYLSSNPSGFGGSSSGIFKSIDGGNGWTAANNGLGSGMAYVVIDPVTPSTLYAGTGFSIFKSIDSGGTWTRIGPQVFSSATLVIDPVTTTTLYSADSGSGGKVSKSTDGGANWQQLNAPSGNAHVGSLAIDPATPSTLYVGGFGSGLFKTTDGGANWTQLNSLSGFIVIDPRSPSTLYIGGSSGVSKSIDGGATWSAVNNGLTSTFLSCLAVNPSTSSVYAGVNAFTPEEEAFVTKLSASGTAFVYSTLLGGTKSSSNSSPTNDDAFAVALDGAGNAYITGLSSSIDFPVSTDSYQPFNRGFSDAFVSKLSNSYIISGLVLDSNNVPVTGAQVTLSDGSSLTSLVTESDGSYQFSRLAEGGNFTVSAFKAHFTMAPSSQTFNSLASNQTQNFVATVTNAPFFTISGQVSSNSTPLSGVSVTLSGSQQAITATDKSGNYSFTVAGGGNYTISASVLGFNLSPPSQTFSNVTADQTANFTGTRVNFVVTNTNDHGAGSLRQAILDANATPGVDNITFNIPGAGVRTIIPLIALPIITDPVVIDATTQPGYAGSPLIELRGNGVSGNGLQINAGSSTIRGFAIGGFNNDSGIFISVNGGNTIQGNYIGIDAGSNVARNNTGISLASPNNLIGGTTAAARNVISGNGFDGIVVGSAGNQIQGNFIGTTSTGSAAIPNGINGIDISGSPQFTNNVIGGSASGAGNVISGNQTGVYLLVAGNTIQGNLIGTDVTGLKAVPNNTGINAGVANTVVGGLTSGARNVISGNSGDGISLGGSGSLLQGNLIGTDITGGAVLGNGGTGLNAGGGALVGGTVATARNIISGNHGFGNVSLGSGATVQGNYIGTDITGNVALNNPLPGITISGSSNIIGGPSADARNVISGNNVGIQIGGSTSGSVASNVIQGNYVGVNQAGISPLPNSSDGIRISALNVPPVGNNTIGGTAAGAGNVIAFNGGRGVMVYSGTGNSIRGNSIFSNGSLGIDLSPLGVTANDNGDSDTGANNLQNFPVLTGLTPNTISGTLNSTAGTTFNIDFYANTSCDLSGIGEGAQFLASTTVVTGGDGNALINFSLGSALPAGTIVTATATDPSGNTSEFSPCLSGALLNLSQASYSVTEGSGQLNVTVNRTGSTALPVAVDYATSDDGASAVPCSTANGKASAKCDFTETFGTLRFAAGETSKTISVLVTQDNYVEGPETFNIALSNAAGATLGSSPTAVITINDDGAEPAGNPIDDNEDFVRQHYHDFLNREADQSGLDFWTGQITSCGSDVGCTQLKRVNVSAAFFLSIEFQQTGYLVERMYKVAYGNATGTSMLGGTSHQLAVPAVRYAEFLKDTQRIGQGVVVLAPGWEQALENNKQAYALEFVATTRFINHYATTLTPAQFVDLLNQNAGNVLSASERANAISFFGGAGNTINLTARAQAVRQVAEDQDLYNAESNSAFVLAQFFGYLRRNPNDPQDTDYTGYEFWLTKLNQFNGDYIAAEMVKAFITSGEYRQRFGQ